ncbi:hypothetical protein OESDEN_08642 [Oesophagostomum dentatum]|uniref:Uncharacterized protein n=1 Tax=Oesophagostomum dentatum TaxID=61180 RepID=A0A0B1T2M5_OESDE|nr:hypothetical protein OESDEN_08642 [Oesophagostomum dentatum]
MAADSIYTQEIVDVAEDFTRWHHATLGLFHLNVQLVQRNYLRVRLEYDGTKICVDGFTEGCLAFAGRAGERLCFSVEKTSH